MSLCSKQITVTMSEKIKFVHFTTPFSLKSDHFSWTFVQIEDNLQKTNYYRLYLALAPRTPSAFYKHREENVLNTTEIFG